ncbi:MAG: class I SAM-dependent methyltransferase [Candidatus Thermoplasmatota archaeon]|jgi:2-polyprenyl-3-methyl-5-hydroxy-6-metoxy-1,4-benzoquinol methylase|nr:class I SAM-dependent methyltransferase [Candidatus Thermoplasmatota archaeon]
MDREFNPGGSHIPLSSQIKNEMRQYKRMGNHWKRYKFTDKMNSGLRVLDYGCGYGFGSMIMERYGEYVGVDIDNEAISWARENIGKVNTRSKFLTPDQLKETYGFNSFDLVISFEVIEHVNDPRNFLEFLSKMVKKDGRILISTPNGFYSHHDRRLLRSDYHIDEYNLLELEKIAIGIGKSIKFYKEYRIDRLDSLGLRLMQFLKIKNLKEQKDELPSLRLKSNQENANLLNAYEAKNISKNSSGRKSVSESLFNFAVRYLNGPEFYHINEITSIRKQSGYGTILALISEF